MSKKFVGDQNQSVFIYESGAFGNPSGPAQWIGQVQSFEPEDEPNIEQIRYQGSGDRDVDDFQATIIDHTISINKFPQDWRSFYFVLGSVADTGSAEPTVPFTHTMIGMNNDDDNGIVTGNVLPSVTLENSQIAGTTGSNAIRTYNGAVLNELALSSDGEGLITMDETWMASNVVFSSGAVSAVTAQTTRTWRASDFSLTLEGTNVDELKGWDLTINNNLVPDHYSNGSINAVSFTALDREVEYSPTIDANEEWFKPLYDQYFLGGSTFNMFLNGIISTGSSELQVTLSGCRIINMEAPTGNSEKNENTLTIVPKKISVVAIDLIEDYKLF